MTCDISKCVEYLGEFNETGYSYVSASVAKDKLPCYAITNCTTFKAKTSYATPVWDCEGKIKL